MFEKRIEFARSSAAATRARMWNVPRVYTRLNCQLYTSRYGKYTRIHVRVSYLFVYTYIQEPNIHQPTRVHSQYRALLWAVTRERVPILITSEYVLQSRYKYVQIRSRVSFENTTMLITEILYNFSRCQKQPASRGANASMYVQVRYVSFVYT